MSSYDGLIIVNDGTCFVDIDWGNELEAENAKLKEENENLRNMFNSCDGNYTEIQTELCQAKEAHARTTQRLGEANKKINELEAKLERLEEEVSGLKGGWGGVSDIMSELDKVIDLIRAVHGQGLCDSGCVFCKALRALGKEADG